MTGIVFDFGNVLYHVDYARMAWQLAGDRAEQLLQRFVGSPLQIAYESGTATLPQVLAELRRAGFSVSENRFLAAFLDIFTPVEGMTELLACLAQRRPLGLLSNTCPEHARLFIERVPEIAHFPVRVYSFQVGCMKPDPLTYREVARRMGISCQRLVYTDDIPAYAMAAETVGMVGIPFRNAADLARHLFQLGFTEVEPYFA